MPRRLLRNGGVVADDWTYLAEAEAAAETAAATATAPAAVTALILTLDRWLAGKAAWLSDKPAWLDRGARLGVVLSPAHRVDTLAPDLGHLALVGAEFLGPGEGRGYSQGRLLRERHGFTGELRATGYVRRDQVFFLARCGFTSFELPDGDMDSAAGAFSTFSAEYQPANDLGLPRTLKRR